MFMLLLQLVTQCAWGVLVMHWQQLSVANQRLLGSQAGRPHVSYILVLETDVIVMIFDLIRQSLNASAVLLSTFGMQCAAAAGGSCLPGGGGPTGPERPGSSMQMPKFAVLHNASKQYQHYHPRAPESNSAILETDLFEREHPLE
jgi:hypothetical protein